MNPDQYPQIGPSADWADLAYLVSGDLNGVHTALVWDSEARYWVLIRREGRDDDGNALDRRIGKGEKAWQAMYDAGFQA